MLRAVGAAATLAAAEASRELQSLARRVLSAEAREVAPLRSAGLPRLRSQHEPCGGER